MEENGSIQQSPGFLSLILIIVVKDFGLTVDEEMDTG